MFSTAIGENVQRQPRKQKSLACPLIPHGTPRSPPRPRQRRNAQPRRGPSLAHTPPPSSRIAPTPRDLGKEGEHRAWSYRTFSTFGHNPQKTPARQLNQPLPLSSPPTRPIPHPQIAQTSIAHPGATLVSQTVVPFVPANPHQNARHTDKGALPNPRPFHTPTLPEPCPPLSPTAHHFLPTGDIFRAAALLASFPGATSETRTLPTRVAADFPSSPLQQTRTAGSFSP